jgi:hypothetical protein
VQSRPPLFQIEPNPRIVRWGWLLWLLWLVVATALLIDDFKSGVLSLALVLSAPFWALWVGWPIYRGLGGWQRWQARARGGRRDGGHYEFDGQPIRTFFDGDRILWSADDVFDALAIHVDARRAERVRQIVGRDGLTAEPASRLLCFSERGLNAWLDRRSEPAAHKFRLWIDKQVIQPYRRRRELERGAKED